ncbi:MAG: hypothetical protein KatS3mg039_1223 [Candidatus Kapaibacterium sp.]|nr:MAG: hypothetical protein KatS3mg039_1223 [Candidatus Kapabacteria bacterium]
MTLPRLQRTQTQVLDVNPYWEYRLDTYRLDDGSERPYYYVHSRGSVMIVPILEDGRILMVRQFRYLWQRESLEFPGGGIPEATTPMDQAHRELQEETGFRASELIDIGDFNPINGITDERCSVFLALGLSAATKADNPAEQTEVVFLSREDIASRIASREIWDGQTLAAWTLYVTHGAVG